MNRIVALGAEAQAATSLALAYPDREALFVSDQPVLDGWDIPTVRFHHATPATWRTPIGRGDLVVPMCPRWLPDEDWSLARTLPHAARAIGAQHVLAVQRAPDASGIWQVKGDRWRRPDAPLSGPASDLVQAVDAHGCGLVYQRQVRARATAMAIGRRLGGAVALGLFRVFEERFFRTAILQAAESIADKLLGDLSLGVLDAIKLEGFFTLNWALTDEGPYLTSVRPVPRAAFGAFRRGGIDPLGPLDGTAVLGPGLRLVAQPHYASFRRLEA